MAGSGKTIFILTALLLLCTSGSLVAQISPGPLHKSHQFLEGVDNCNKCHDPNRDALADNCLQCHTAIRDQRTSGRGLHSGADYVQCEMCHVEHHGEEYDLVYFKGGPEAFDHTQTGYALLDAHARLECRQCHTAGHIKNSAVSQDKNVNLERTFLGLSQQCLSCHTDEHRGQLSQDCASCHNYAAWRPAASFDHANTRFPLTGNHMSTDCYKCHSFVVDAALSDDTSYAHFRPLEHNACTDCHKDPHENRLGRDCQRCHTTAGWKNVQTNDFDHSRTRYPLEGKHSSVACEKCHGQQRRNNQLEFDNCRDCHNDFHNNAFAARSSKGACEECHSVGGFTPARFSVAQHDSSDYPLSGAHLAVPCTGCHLSTQSGKKDYKFTFSGSGCLECHRDAHEGNVKKYTADGGCKTCHSVQDWTAITYDHSDTKFPLSDKHAQAECIACHGPKVRPVSARDVQFVGIVTACAGCHNDVHHNQFVVDDLNDCTRCHNPSGWVATGFDHATDSRFRLDGAHQKVPCDRCHPKVDIDGASYVKYKPIDHTCKDCHSQAELEGAKKS